MNEVLAMCGDLREIRIAKGESLIAQVLPDARNRSSVDDAGPMVFRTAKRRCKGLPSLLNSPSLYPFHTKLMKRPPYSANRSRRSLPIP